MFASLTYDGPRRLGWKVPTKIIDDPNRGFVRVPDPSKRRPIWSSDSPDPYAQKPLDGHDSRYSKGHSRPYFLPPLNDEVQQEDYRDVYDDESTDMLDDDMLDVMEDAYDTQGGPKIRKKRKRTKYLKRSVSDAIAWATRQIRRPSQSWYKLCQSFVRQAYGVPGWADSAQLAWDKIPNHKKTIGGSPFSAPRGAALYYSGGEFGHVALATRTKCLSNDYRRSGKINFAPRNFPKWNQKYLGWSMWTPFGEMRPYS